MPLLRRHLPWVLVAVLGAFALAWRHNDGLDYVPTDRHVPYGHHFAAIAGAGPLVGPVLAARVGTTPEAVAQTLKAHMRASPPGQPPMDHEQFFRSRQQARYGGGRALLLKRPALSFPGTED